MSWLRHHRADLAFALFLAIFTIVRGLLWIGVYPALKIVDEPAHFDSIQYRAAHRFRAPRADGTRIDKVFPNSASPELRAAWRATQGLFRDSFTNGRFGSPHERALESMVGDRNARSTTGQSTALTNPSVYYAFATIVYRAFDGSSVLTRIFAVRTASLLWGVLLVVCTYLAARCTFSSRLLAFTAAFLAALQPLAVQQTVAIHSDAALLGLGALAFCLQMFLVGKIDRPPILAVAALAITMALAVETKAYAYALVPGCCVLAIGVIALRPRTLRSLALVACGLLSFLIVRALCGSATSGYALLRRTPTPSLIDFVGWFWNREDAYWTSLFHSAWGSFCWLDVGLADAWFAPIQLMATLTWLGLAAAIVRRMLRPDDSFFWQLAPSTFAVFTSLAGFFVVLFIDYFGNVALNLDHAVSGRAFLVVLPAFAVVATAALCSLVPRRLRPLCAVLLVAGALILSAGSILTVLRFQYVS